ncbi:hypothetical protein BC828DRAFT_241385 [Blastocladiella britannica]|nr:hypothetical protein BC828DRAFT_241385 [Blastocladiella britannica]
MDPTTPATAVPGVRETTGAVHVHFAATFFFPWKRRFLRLSLRPTLATLSMHKSAENPPAGMLHITPFTTVQVVDYKGRTAVRVESDAAADHPHVWHFVPASGDLDLPSWLAALRSAIMAMQAELRRAMAPPPSVPVISAPAVVAAAALPSTVTASQRQGPSQPQAAAPPTLRPLAATTTDIAAAVPPPSPRTVSFPDDPAWGVSPVPILSGAAAGMRESDPVASSSPRIMQLRKVSPPPPSKTSAGSAPSPSTQAQYHSMPRPAIVAPPNGMVGALSQIAAQPRTDSSATATATTTTTTLSPPQRGSGGNGSGGSSIARGLPPAPPSPRFPIPFPPHFGGSGSRSAPSSDLGVDGNEDDLDLSYYSEVGQSSPGPARGRAKAPPPMPSARTGGLGPRGMSLMTTRAVPRSTSVPRLPSSATTALPTTPSPVMTRAPSPLMPMMPPMPSSSSSARPQQQQQQFGGPLPPRKDSGSSVLSRHMSPPAAMAMMMDRGPLPSPPTTPGRTGTSSTSPVATLATAPSNNNKTAPISAPPTGRSPLGTRPPEMMPAVPPPPSSSAPRSNEFPSPTHSAFSVTATGSDLAQPPGAVLAASTSSTSTAPVRSRSFFPGTTDVARAARLREMVNAAAGSE